MKSLRILMFWLLITALLFLSALPVSAQDEVPPPPDPVDEETQPQNPVELYLAGVTGLTPQEISGLHQQGYGLGNISKATLLCQASTEQVQTGTEQEQTGVSLDCLTATLEKAKGMGWGKLLKQAGLHPGGGVGWLFKGKGKTAMNGAGTGTGWMPPGKAKKNNAIVPAGQQKNQDKHPGKKGKK